MGGFAKCFQTSHSAVICEPGHLSLNLFVFNLPRLIADVHPSDISVDEAGGGQ